MSSGIRLIVGLGNPGAQYEKTRHNAGAWFVDYLAEQAGSSLRAQSKLHAYLTKITIGTTSIFLAKPATFMNESGRAVLAIAQFYKLPPKAVLVVHDELDFPPGDVRLKCGGGHGGHNGLRDISRCFSSDFYRLRIGIGHPGHKDRVSPYVLSAPSRTDQTDITLSIDQAARVMPLLVSGEFDQAFRQLHSD